LGFFLMKAGTLSSKKKPKNISKASNPKIFGLPRSRV
jgi:hypothetical protein